MNLEEEKTIEYLKVGDLLFDPENPRLPQSVIDTSDERQVINWMLQDASILELMGAIGEKGFFPAEPLLVTAAKDSKLKFIVVEGNRRLAAVKLLHNPKLADKRVNAINQIVSEKKFAPTRLPVFKYKTREEILDYLGFRHITGVKAWSPLAKAKYLRELQFQYKNLSLEEEYYNLAKAIGSRVDYVKQLLIGLKMFDIIAREDYFDIKNLREDTIDFGVYYNALRWNNISAYLKIDSEAKDPVKNISEPHLKNLVKWVSEKNDQNVTRLGESRNLKQLNEILGVAKARLAFESGKSLEEALIYTEEPSDIFSKSIQESLKKINTANSYVHSVEQPKESDEQSVSEINAISENLRYLIRKKLDSIGQKRHKNGDWEKSR